MMPRGLSLVWQMARRDFLERHSGSALGVIWNLVHPLVMVFIFTVVFAEVMGARMPHQHQGTFAYGIYLMSGLLPWTAFSNSILRCATVFAVKKQVIGQIDLPLALLPLYVVLSEGITFCFTMTVLAMFLTASGAPPGPHFALVPLLFVLHQTLAYGLGLLLAVFNVFLKDLQEVTGIVIQLWFWFTPIVYLAHVLPAALRPLAAGNPATWFIDAYRAVVMDHAWPAPGGLFAVAVVGLVVCLLALWALRKLERDVRDFI